MAEVKPGKKTRTRTRARLLPTGVADSVGMILALCALTAIFGLKAKHFFELKTFQTIANQIPDAVVISVGVTFVLIIGGIDLSVGSVLALCSAVMGAVLLRTEMPLPVAVLACVITGLACGSINGLLISGLKLPAFIVTLGMMEIARGATYMITGSRTAYIGSRVEVIAEQSLFGLSLPFLTALAVASAGQFALSRTVFGRHALAVGANEQAARYSGIGARKVKWMVYALCGALSGVAAVINCARLGSADPNAGTGFELQAIAAVVIGGTSLMGGRGSVVGTFLGVCIIAVLGAGLAQIGAQESTKRFITGCVIIAAVILDYYRRRLRASSGAA
ncbi:MAG TPA: ABC transporter permease [Candidatus Brocadiia bacterium]|nr:ABC transporter permease [Candidatus Brocadiia bacterium]